MFNNLLSIASLLALASATPLLSDLLEFDPPSIQLADSNLGNKFRCRLKEKPAKPVKVYFEAAGLQFSDCFIDIDVEQFDQWREVSIFGSQVFETRTNVDITINARAFIEEEKHDQTLPCHRTIAPAGTCTSSGDPHFSCFNGAAITFLKGGCFHLINHEHLQIQAVHGDCDFVGKATCNHAIAVRYGSSIIALDIRDKDKSKHILTQITQNVDGIKYDAPTVADSFHTITLPCGSKITLQVNYDTKNKWIDHTVHLAAGYEEVGGFCNRHGETGLKCRDGTVVGNDKVDIFGESWIVKDEENIFLGKYQKTQPPVVGIHAVCKIPDTIVTVVPPAPCTLPPFVPPPFTTSPATTTNAPVVVPTTTTIVQVQTTTVPATTVVQTTTVAATTTIPATTIVQTTTTVQTQDNAATTNTLVQTTVVPATTTVAPTAVVQTTTIPATVVVQTTTLTQVVQTTTNSAVQTTLPPAPPAYNDDVKKHCTEIFQVEGCSSLLDVNFYIDACIKDATTCGSLVFAETHRMTFMSSCHKKTEYMAVDYDQPTVTNATQVQTQCGFNGHKCINDCSGHGVCGAYGCRCQPTWGGKDCSIDLTKKMSYNPVAKTYVPFTPPTVYCKAQDNLPAPVAPPAQNPQVYVQDQVAAEQVKAVYGSVNENIANTTYSTATTTDAAIVSSAESSFKVMAAFVAIAAYAL
ncbi:hypothetical protein HK103_005705 [Boothiomyces macroporosus]|uniref:VWFD domain-containing protein n=1 Tax=Boothiomyces macroporosus TaxID=261099 RepID=A0AAD5UEV1_9FUNG|nr:hypothetical protein HK103_005705 [Boothiomyces macroporosus]